MDDKIVNGIDTQNALDDIEISIDKLIKKKRLWTGIAVLCFIVWLLILMYTIFWGTAHQDTIKPTEPPPTIANKPIKEPKQVNKTENIKVKEYVFKADDLVPKYTGDCYVKVGYYGDGSDRMCYNPAVEALEAYSKKCAIKYKVEVGDDNFTASREDSNASFVSDKKFSSFTGYKQTVVAMDIGSDNNYEEKCKECGDNRWVIVAEDPFTRKDLITGVGVIVSDESSIQSGVDALLKKVNALKFNGVDKPHCEIFTLGYLSPQETLDLVGECFNTKGYLLTNSEYKGVDSILLEQTSNGGVSLSCPDLKDGDTLVYFSMEDWFFTKYSAGQYSKILQGTYEGRVYDK